MERLADDTKLVTNMHNLNAHGNTTTANLQSGHFIGLHDASKLFLHG